MGTAEPKLALLRYSGEVGTKARATRNQPFRLRRGWCAGALYNAMLL